MGFYWRKKTEFLIPKNVILAFCRLTARSTEPEVGRPGGQPICTNVHNLVWLEGRSTDPVDRQRFLFFGSGHGRPGGRPTESFCSLYLGLGRLAGRPMVQWSEIWPLASRPGSRPTTESFAELSPTACFWSLFIWDCFWLFLTRF